MHVCVENLPSTTLKSVAAAIRAVVQPLSPKRIERITGRLQWFFGPQQSAFVKARRSARFTDNNMMSSR